MIIYYDKKDHSVLCPRCGKPMYANVEANWSEPAYLDRDGVEGGILELCGDPTQIEAVSLECTACGNHIDLLEQLDIAYEPKPEPEVEHAPQAKRAC